jgi:hypothetical protein
MSLTLREGASLESAAAFGGSADAIGGIATVILAICGLAGVNSPFLAVIATVVFGAGLLIHAASLRARYSQSIGLPGEDVAGDGGGGFAGLFLIGAAGLLRGVLALLGVDPGVLNPIATIAYGAALLLGGGAARHMLALRHATARPEELTRKTMLAGEMACGAANLQTMGGLAAMVLGILAVLDRTPNDLVFNLVALLILGVTLILTGSTFNAAMLGSARNWTKL